MTHPYVTSDPGVMGGIPCIKGTRVPAYLVAGLVLDGVPPRRLKAFYGPRVTAAAARDAAAWFAETDC